MEYGVEWSKAKGIEKISLDVYNNNPRAINLYEKFGFIVEGIRRKQYIIDGELLMKYLWLSSYNKPQKLT